MHLKWVHGLVCIQYSPGTMRAWARMHGFCLIFLNRICQYQLIFSYWLLDRFVYWIGLFIGSVCLSDRFVYRIGLFIGSVCLSDQFVYQISSRSDIIGGQLQVY